MPFSESSIKTLEPTVRSKASLAVHRIREEMETRGAADVFKWFLFYSTDVIGELSFGESFRMLEIGKVTKSEVREASLALSRLTYPRRKTNTSPIWKA